MASLEIRNAGKEYEFRVLPDDIEGVELHASDFFHIIDDAALSS
jgi:hypothetical protein